MFSAVILLLGLTFIPVEVRAETVAEFRARKFQEAKAHRSSNSTRKYLKPEKNPDKTHRYKWTTGGWKHDNDD